MIWLNDEEREWASEYEDSKKRNFAQADGNFVAISVGLRSVRIELPRQMRYSEAVAHARAIGHDIVRGAYDAKGCYHDRYTKIEY